MIRVLHVIDKLSIGGSSIHGITRALSWWLPRMDPAEFSFSVCSLREPEEAARFFEDVGIPVHFLNRGKFDPRTLTDLMALARKERVDVLHLHGYGATNFGRLAGAFLQIPRVLHEHAVLDDQPAYQTVADTLLSPLTTRAIAISPPVREFMVRRRKIRPEKIDCFFFGIPLDEFSPSDSDVLQTKREQLGIAPLQPVISCVGRLEVRKGYPYLITAMAKVIKHFPEAMLLIVGAGEGLDEFVRQRDRLGLTESVIFTGHRDDVADVFALSDVVAIPSLSEGGPITLFEAMSVGRPVVGTPVGLMPDVIDEGRTGYLVPVGEAEPLADRLIELLNHPERCEKMRRAAYQDVQEYGMSRAVERLTDVYRGLV